MNPMNPRMHRPGLKIAVWALVAVIPLLITSAVIAFAVNLNMIFSPDWLPLSTSPSPMSRPAALDTPSVTAGVGLLAL